MTPDEIVLRWSRATTHREKASLERDLREAMGTTSSDLAMLIPVSQYELTMRTRFLRSGSQAVWRLLDEESVQVGVVRKILVRAEGIAATRKIPLDEAVMAEYEDSQREAGPRSQSSAARGWDLIRATVHSMIEGELSGLDEIERKSLTEEVMVDVDVLIRQVKFRIRARAKNGVPKNWGLPSKQQAKASRRQFCADMRELGLDAPRPGRAPDMDEVRKTHRRVSADHHPDKRKEQGAADKFNSVNQAYKRILEYVESMKGSEE